MLRPAVQALFLAAFVAMFLSLGYPANVPLNNIYLAADPLIVVASILFFKGSWLPLLWPAIGLLLASMLLGRVFCGWACPVGFLSDISSRIARLVRLKPLTLRLEHVQYGFLAAALLASLLTLDVLSILDPMVIFQRSLYLIWSMSGIPIVLLLILLGSLLAPRLWCRVCPLGAMFGLASVVSPFGRKVGAGCTQCMKCRRSCPMGAISKDNQWDAALCTKCLDCERACPEGVIGFYPAKPSPMVSASRRSVLAAGASLGFLAIAKTAAASPGPSLIRPPGSLVESKFNAACARCGSCARACLGGVIRPAGLDVGLERAFTPMLDFSRSKCERCGTCGAVCSTGAIISVPEANMKMGTASIDRKRCIAWAQHKKCLICAEICPASAVKGAGSLQPRVDGDTCVGCGSCELNCPTSEKAITVSSVGERRRDG